jgi:hypothetical protein
MSIVLWIFGVAFGFLWATHKTPPANVVFLIVVPSTTEKAPTEDELSEALDNVVGEEGLAQQLRVQHKYLDVPEDRDLCEDLGLLTATDAILAIVEVDANARPIKLLEMWRDIEDPNETAHEALERARYWAEM